MILLAVLAVLVFVEAVALAYLVQLVARGPRRIDYAREGYATNYTTWCWTWLRGWRMVERFQITSGFGQW